MAAQPGEDVVAVLPDGLDDDQRRVLGQVLEDLDAGALAVDEPVALGLVHQGAARSFSSFSWVGQHVVLAAGRRSPLVTV
ncbi:hypothetical protein [Streptomyces coelicoflavus]|uniref:hypothetical protein n=1 Tax=Streptomyces coelicoflavus TaxID=285562 RepID=UPI001EF21CBC|nr:hypothetical protein [Streptomyces coelicoflavus]